MAADCEAEIESLFDEMYELTLTPREETRTRTVTVTNEETGEEEEVEEEYTVTILDVELTRKPLEDIVSERLTGNDDASVLYAAYQQTNGALQQFYTPLDTDWYSLIKSYYGYRKNPITGENQFHRGIDIAVPEIKKELIQREEENSDGLQVKRQPDGRCHGKHSHKRQCYTRRMV